ncbi:MAG: hypothetical protein U0935_01085 [Pirellulales bacterium]
MDPHPLTQQVDAVVRRGRHWTSICLWARWASLAGGSAWLLGAIDYGLRFEDRGVRVVLSLLFASIAAGAAWKLWRSPWNRDWDSLLVAQQIERRYPALRGLLASSLEFLRAEAADPTAGSLTLRRAVIDRAAVAAGGLDFSTVLNRQPVVRAVALAGAVALLLAASVGVRPSAAGLAALRLVLPWEDLTWPRRHKLHFAPLPTRLAAGQDLEITLLDANGRLPADATIEWKYSDDPADRGEAHLNPGQADRLSYRMERVTRSVQIRAAGGDDHTMDWHSVKVVEAPRVELRELHVTPPSYTGQPRRPAQPPLRVLAGSQVDLRAESNRPVSSACIRRAGAPADAPIPLAISDDGLTLSLVATDRSPWIIRESGTYELDVTDSDDVTATIFRWVVEAIADQPPTLSLTAPAAAGYATPEAHLAVRGLARDDVGVRRIVGRYRLANQSAETPRELPWYPLPPAAVPEASAAAPSNPPGDAQRVDLQATWVLAEDDRLVAGVVVEYWGEAVDARDQTSPAEIRRLEIVSPDEFAQRMGRREAAILEQLRDALRVQRDAHGQMQTVAQTATTPPLGPQVADQLQAIELAQRNVRRLLGDEQAGALTLLESLQEDWRQNVTTDVPALERLRTIHRQLTPLVSGDLPAIERDLQHCVRSVRESQRGPEEPWQQSVQRQQRVISTLEQIVQQLAPWDEIHRHAVDLAEIRSAVRDVQQRTEDQLAQQTNADDQDEARTAAAAQRRQLAERQFELGRRLDRILGDLEAAVAPNGSVGEPTPLAQSIAQALAAARRSTLNGQLREAGQATLDNRLGAAAEKQTRTLTALDEVLDALAQRSPAGSAESPGAAAQAARQQQAAWDAAVEELIAAQTAVVNQLPPATDRPATDRPATDRPATERSAADRPATDRPATAASATPWSSHQRSVAQQAEDQLATLPDIPTFRFVLRGAVSRMRRAALGAEQGRPSEAASAARAALARLEQLRQATHDLTAASPPSLPPPSEVPAAERSPQAPGQGRGSVAELKLLRALQADLLQRTAELEAQRAPPQALREDQREALRELAREQGELVQLLSGMLP